MEDTSVAGEMPVEVPAQWRDRGFSGRYHRRVEVPVDVATALIEMGPPCQAPRDRAWLVTEVTVGERAGQVVMVRLDVSAQLDLSTKRPGPGAYRVPGR